ncbi:MAG: Tex-like N-terminal domain-containing protein [Gammaproteobacteria bacterium]|nr:Tex-like N-terminal domain-containing protein [Gammaproteobacteria bacterium]
MLPPIADRIATEIAARSNQVDAAIRLLDDGATVPFIARYRKEATGGLDDTQLRNLEERLRYLRELESRREAVLESIGDQGRLTPELETSIRAAETKQRLEDLYAPYKPKRRTRAQIAAEAGLEALADALLADPSLDPEAMAGDYLCPAFTTAEGDENPGVADPKAALDGARWILMERFAEDPDLVGELRELLAGRGVLCSRVADGKAEAGAKFRDYFEYQEALAAIPSHRALALFRGRSEDVLRLEVKLPEELETDRGPLEPGPCEHRIAARYDLGDRGRPADGWLMEVVRFTWRARLAWQLETQLLGGLRERAEEEAIRVFARNLRDLLLAAPAGARPTLGLDPGIRTGVKVAVVDATGQLVATDDHLSVPRAEERTGAAPPASWTAGRRPTASSWSPSATAPPPGRPSSWWPSCRTRNRACA